MRFGSSDMDARGEGSVRVGVIGCGNVSSRYLTNLVGQPHLLLQACADSDPNRAETLAADHGVPDVCSVDEMLNHPQVDLVLNLTPPAAHAGMTLQALKGGKHVYSEKPLATSLEDARRILDAALETGLQVGTAPDTFMGVGARTCRRLISEGVIGTPVSVSAAMMNPGPERFHPDPAFLYRTGGGPLFDIGPYYVTMLTALLGPIVKVGALGGAARNERIILAGPRIGSVFPVETETHINSVLEFDDGVLGTLVTSFDVTSTQTPNLEIHGTEGTIIAAQANSWGGPVCIRTAGDTEFTEVLGSAKDSDGFMGMGLVEMAEAIVQGRQAEANATRGYHVLEVLIRISESVRSGGTFTAISPTWKIAA